MMRRKRLTETTRPWHAGLTAAAAAPLLLYAVVLTTAIASSRASSSTGASSRFLPVKLRAFVPRGHHQSTLEGGIVAPRQRATQVLLDEDALLLLRRTERSWARPLVLSSSTVLDLRGGASRDNDESDAEAGEDSDDEDVMIDFDEDEAFDDDMDLDGANTMEERDFAEDNTLDRALEAWKKTPPLTKGYLGASVAATVFGYVFNQNQFPPLLLLDWKKVMTGQVWRLFTSFLNFGPLGLGYIMTAHFVWTYMATLERLNHNKPYDFWIMIAFGQLSMVIGYPLLKLSPGFLGHNLSTFLVYIWSRYHEGIQVSMFDLFTARAEMLPWFFLAQTFLLEGELPLLDFLGIVFGHIYHHCKTVGILRAPKELVNWYKSDSEWATRIRELYKPISSDFEMVA